MFDKVTPMGGLGLPRIPHLVVGGGQLGAVAPVVVGVHVSGGARHEHGEHRAQKGAACLHHRGNAVHALFGAGVQLSTDGKHVITRRDDVSAFTVPGFQQLTVVVEPTS